MDDEQLRVRSAMCIYIETTRTRFGVCTHLSEELLQNVTIFRNVLCSVNELLERVQYTLCVPTRKLEVCSEMRIVAGYVCRRGNT